MFDSAPWRIYWEVTRACDLACRHGGARAAPAQYPAELSPSEGLDLIPSTEKDDTAAQAAHVGDCLSMMARK